jgi:restriction system protein
VTIFRLRPLDGPPVDITTRQLVQSVEPQIAVATATIAERLKKDPDGMHALTSRQFEQLIVEILTDRGHEAYLTPASRDGGKDVLVYFNSDFGKLLCLVEAKLYRPHGKVGFGIVQRLYGAFASHGASCAMLITTSSFSQPARSFQSKHRYQLALRDYADLVAWLRAYGTACERNGPSGSVP